jgi:hypothetical protein
MKYTQLNQSFDLIESNHAQNLTSKGALLAKVRRYKPHLQLSWFDFLFVPRGF